MITDRTLCNVVILIAHNYGKNHKKVISLDMLYEIIKIYISRYLLLNRTIFVIDHHWI
jgi:hypothetical protein